MSRLRRAVRDQSSSVDEVRTGEIELLGEPCPTWQHFCGPNGNVYELIAV
ncbi:MAG: hypothetical protein ACYCST_01100 [Acidimicrobiales bacterium]